MIKGSDAGIQSQVKRIRRFGQEEILFFQLLPDANSESVSGDFPHVSRQGPLTFPILLLDHDISERMNFVELRDPMFVLLDEKGPMG